MPRVLFYPPTMPQAKLSFHPASAERFKDIERLFGDNGACAGCWCMWWRLPHGRWVAQKGSENRRALKVLVASKAAPGVLAYADAAPVGWCAIAPREVYPRLDRSRILRPVDDRPVWSITCFFVARSHRKQGVSSGLLGAAVELARRAGASIIEAYPVEPAQGKAADAFVFTGLASSFLRAGFQEVARRSATRPIMRLTIG